MPRHSALRLALSSISGDGSTPVKRIEGFKAASDLFSVMDGAFVTGNPILEVDACIVKSSPYADGWLYSVRGEPEEMSVDVHGYVDHLAALIEKMQQEGY